MEPCFETFRMRQLVKILLPAAGHALSEARRGRAEESLGQETSPCASVGVALRRGMTGAAVGGACTAIMTAKDTLFFYIVSNQGRSRPSKHSGSWAHGTPLHFFFLFEVLYKFVTEDCSSGDS